MEQVGSDTRGILLTGELTIARLGAVEREIERHLRQFSASELRFDLSGVTALDTAGAVYLHRLPDLAGQAGRKVQLTDLPASLQPLYDFVARRRRPSAVEPERVGLLENLGGQIIELNHQLATFLFLASDLTWIAITTLFRPRGIRRGTLTDQAIAVGSSALPIISLILFLIGAVSSLQAAAQLRQFGANIFVADLLAIGITRELGPLMTAIIVAGRSGSSIAAEIATMKFTEELDALQTMALDPLRFVAVPKLWAMILCMPMLTIMADFIGIMGGTLIGVTSIGISPQTFFSQVLGALFLKDILTGLIKSFSFAWAITVIGVFRGLNFSGGAAGVGRATTASVVTSIFGIIILDCFWGLLFYMR